MKRRLKRFKLYAMFMVLVLMISSETQYVFASENEVFENLPEDDMEHSIPENVDFASEKSLIIEDLDVTITGEETTIYGSEEQIAAMSEEPDSSLYTGTVSGCLSESGTYALYGVELPAGSYLQARLTLPNNNQIDYDLVLYDSALSVIKTSDYLTYLNAAGTLAESIGYKAVSTEKVYIGVFSSRGGSDTEEYTLDFSITTNYSEDSEPNENAQEAAALDLGVSGANVSGILNSAIDNDWYSFTVLDTPEYDKVRLGVTSNSVVNDCRLEVYRNLTSDYFAMQLVATGKSGEIDLPAGTYFLRIISTNTLNDFNAADCPTYNLSVIPVGRVDGIKITTYSGGCELAQCTYSEGTYYRTYEVPNMPNTIDIYGRAYYQKGPNTYAANNVIIDATITDLQWKDTKPEWAKVYGTAVTTADRNGYFKMKVSLNPLCGGLRYVGSRYIHVYDLMEVEITVHDRDDLSDWDYFYYERKIN